MGRGSTEQGPEPTLLRPRTTGSSPAGTSPPELHRAALRDGWLRLAAVALPAITASFVLVPQLASRSYPTTTESLGKPVTENIKAPHDITVVDPDMTARMRDEAVSAVRRVYDFDKLVSGELGERIRAALAALPHGAGDVDDTAWRAAAARLSRALDVELDPAAVHSLAVDPRLAAAWVRLVTETNAQPIVTDREALAEDVEHGITVQRVPADGSPDASLATDAVSTVEGARRALERQAEEALHAAEPGVRAALIAAAQRLIQPTLTLNRATTEMAREVAALSVKPITIAMKKGEMIIRDGERITSRHLYVFNALAQSRRSSLLILSTVGAGAVVLALLLTALAFGRDASKRITVGVRDLVFLSVLFSCVLLGARVWLTIAGLVHDRFSGLPEEGLVFLFPFAAAPMMARLVLRLRVALVFGALLSIVIGLMVDPDTLYTVFAVVGTAVGASAMRNISARGDVLKAGFYAGLAQAGAALAILLFQAHTDALAYVSTILLAFLGGAVSGFAALALTPALELAFGYTTALKLLELANLNHPALKELIVQAPGSYHHSVIVGSLVETAAEAIGANPLLARVMSYYHDLGKGMNPSYFIENQRAGENPHDKLKPSMSAMIIKRHITDGLEIARKHRLGEQIMAAIAEHHGTTLIRYFYEKAKEQEDPTSPVAESDYRYASRKPQSRETALVMLADSVEAASRSLPEPTPARLQGLVTRIINTKFTDGQLEQCDLTLRDLHVIAKSFCRVLNSIYHQRVEYPSSTKDGGGKRGHGDPDPKSTRRADDPDCAPAEDRPDNLRRLGLS